MIARDSKSYPYLAIAQHYGISYREVLRLSDYYDRNRISSPITDWHLAVWLLERDKIVGKGESK